MGCVGGGGGGGGGEQSPRTTNISIMHMLVNSLGTVH